MSGILSPKMPGMNQNIFLGIQFQSSNYGVALPLLYGTQRIPGKMVDYDDFQIIPNSSPVGKGGGVAVYSYTYLCGALLALCEGPVTGINRVWSNTQVLTLAGLSATMSGGISFYYGTQPQSPWPYWTGKHPNKSIGYAGIAYLGAGQWNLGSSAAMPNNNFEVTGLLATEVDSTSRIYLGQGTGSQHSFYLLDPNGNYITNMAPYPAAAYFVNGVQVLSGYTIAQSGSNWALSFTTPPANGAIIQWSTFLLALDAKPSAVLIDFLTSPNHGVPGWSAADIADNVTGPSSWQSYCNAMQFTVSPYYDSQKAASDWIQDLLTATNSEAVLHAGASGAQLQVVPYGDQGVTGPVNSLVADGSFLTGLYYQIVYAGNTAWTSYGAPSSNPGTLFQASSAGGSGSGLALPVLLSGVAQSAAGSWTIGTVYMILTLGSASNATWNTAMGTSGVTPVAATVQSGATVATGGTVFTAANNGSACTGAVVIQVNVALLSVNGHGVVYQGGIMGQLVVGNLYQIATNTSNAWTQVGAINNNVGTIFQATGTGYSPGPQGTNRLGSDTANGVTLGSGTGSAVTAGSFSIGQVYQILSIGTTNFNNCGFVGTPAVSGIFTATTAGSGTGTAAPVQVTLLGAPSTYAGNFIVGNIYQITFAGTTSWTSIGAANNNVGTQFIATGVGSGTGSATLCTTYVPNTTALYNLTYDDFIGAVEPHGEVTDDPIKIERSANSETYNTIPVEFLDRQNAYNISTVQDPDPVNYALYGTTKGSSLSLHLITRMTHAQILSRIAAQRSVYIRRAFKFKTSWKYMLLEPMDLITLTDPKIGINQLMVRVTSVTFPDKDSEDGGLEIEAEEWPFGVGHAAIGNGQGSTSGWVNTAADPGPVAVPVILDVPALASVSGNPEILIACAGAGWGSSQGNAYWGGADVWISLDGGASYVFEGTINGPCHYGSLMSNLTSTAVGTVAQFDFTLSNDSTSLQSVTTTTAQDGATPVWINGEVVDYSTISLAGTSFQYNATLAVRGAYGTTAATQSAGAPVVALDGVPFRWQVPNSLLGVPIYVKLVSTNLWGFNGNQTLANTTAYAHTPAGAGTSGGDYMNPISLVPNFNSQYGPVSGIAGVGVLNTSGLAFPGYAGSPYVRAQQALPSGWNAITNPIPCQAGDVFNYNDQATCTVNNSSTWPYVLQVEFYGASGTDLGSGILADGLSYLKEHVVPMGGWVAGTWYWDSYQATAPANAAYCVCSLYGLGGAGSSDYWVSDIILTKHAYVASSSVLGPVKVGNGLTVAGDGTVSTTLEALLASTAPGEGDDLLATLGSLTGEASSTQHQSNMNIKSILNWMTPAQVAAWQAAQSTYDMTSTINLAIAGINSRGGGTLVFPFVGTGVYNVANSSTVANWQSIFMLSSNTQIVFERGVKMTVNGCTPAAAGVWGVATQANAATAVDNVSFKDVWVVSNSSTPNPLAAFQLNGPSGVTTAAGSISNIHYEKCRVENCIGFFIVENLAGGGAAGRLYNRTTQNVHIDRCTGKNVMTFINADGADIQISKPIATGSATLGDGITVLCGVNVSIDSPDFSNFQNGNCIDISDDASNGLGPNGVKVRGGILHDNGTTATVVKIAGNEGTTYGVTNVEIVGMLIENSGTSISVTNTGGTPSQLKNIKIDGNTIDNCQVGLQSLNGATLIPYNVSFNGNTVNMPAGAAFPALAFSNLQLGTVCGNHCYSANPGATYVLTDIEACSYINESGNDYFASCTTPQVNLRGATSQNDKYEFASNSVYNTIQFVFPLSGGNKIKSNNFNGFVTLNGKNVGIQWFDFDNGNITCSGSASPTTQAWIQGDRVINTAPASAGYTGWVCTAAGTPGTWKTYGLIS